MFNLNNFHGRKALEMYLEFDYADNGRKAEILNQIPMSVPHVFEQDGELHQSNVRELLIGGSVQDTTLIQTEFYETVMKGAEPVVCMRNYLPIISLTKGDTLQIPKGSKGAYASDWAEMTEVPKKNQQYKPGSVTVKKIGDAPEISYEMINDSKYGLIALEIEKSGRRMENKFNRDVLRAMLESGLQTHDTQGSSQGADAVLEAQAKVGDKDYIADKVVTHPRLSGKLLKELFPSVNNSGYNSDAVRTGQIGQELLGMMVLKTSTNPASKSITWGYNSDSYYGGIVGDVLNFGAIVLREDIQIENYKDPIKQIQGATLSMRFETGIMNSDAACAIIY